jgi:TonB family protein
VSARGPLGLALALLTALPASASLPPPGPPEVVRPFTFESWTGGCTETGGCGAFIPWGEGRITISFEQPRAIPPPLRPARISYRFMTLCPSYGQVDLWQPFEAPLDLAGDVAAHLRTAIENGTSGCPVPPIDDETAASITRLVRLFTLVGGAKVKSHDYTVPAPFDSMWNHNPINPDIWIDEVADYPASPKRSRQGGAVETELTIRSDSGRAVMCTVLNSSGVAALDEATCRLLLRRARFEPGAGPAGISRFVIRTVWDISRVDVPYCTGLRCKVGPDGRPVKGDRFIFK